jgi:uncharacterized RDD family membrane protein YckC
MIEQEYAGFWIRAWASLIDTILVLIVLVPLIVSIYGLNYMSMESVNASSSYSASFYSFEGKGNFIINYILPAFIVLAFWIYKSATPGKMLTKLKIVDAKTGEKPSLRQFMLRYLGYFVSSFIFCLGFIWIAFDKRKQGWHDKIAGTVVIREFSKEAVKFSKEEDL